MTLKKEWIQVFVRELNACEHISDFDTDFLNIPEQIKAFKYGQCQHSPFRPDIF